MTFDCPTFTRRTLAQLMAAAALAPAPLAAQGRPPLSRIAFGSCADQAKPQPIWDAIFAYRPELFIFAGDNVYSDFNTADATNLERAYELAEGIAGYAKLRETIPHLAVWDDHDYGVNDGGGDFPNKAISKELFLKFWKAPGTDIRRNRDGIYDSRIIGPPGMRVQVLAEGHGWERWGNMPLERQKLVDTIRDSGAKGVVLLSGDRHVGALYRETPPGLYPLYELTSSGLNMIYWAAKESGPNRLGALYAAANFGVVDIDWGKHKLTLALRDEGGNTRRSKVLSFNELGLAG